jgi:hypothetical protein
VQLPSASVARSQRAAAPTRVLPAAALGPISGAIGADGPSYRVLRSGGRSFRAVNPGQRLSARFGASNNVSVRSGSATLGLHLTAAGYGGSLRPLGAVAPRAAAPNRVEYARGGVSEWYANGPFGIEQGFTVDRRPSSSGATTLALRIAVSGNVRASIARGAGEIALRAPDGDALRYGAIAASDASGRALPIRMALEGRAIVLRVKVAGARFPLTVDPMIEQPQASPAPPGEDAEGRFGYSVALSANGTTALVGAPGDNGLAGAAWVFTRSGSTWTQQGPKLTAPGGSAEAGCNEGVSACGFGRSVALSADGATALIGAPRVDEARGAAWVFTRSGSTWTQFGEPLAPDAEARNSGSFGRSVVLSGDGNTALVGAPSAESTRGAAWAFERSASGFVSFGAELTGGSESGPGGYFGRSVALSADGATALIGAPGDAGRTGGAWTFARSSGGWLPSAKLTAGGEAVGEARFGSSVALSAGGETALIGARTDAEGVGAAWAFERSGSVWDHLGPKLTAEGEIGAGQFGWSVALSADGQTALIGAPHDDAAIGAAWTLIRAGGGWMQEAEQLSGAAEPGKDLFGTAAALSGDSSTALIGAPRAARRIGSVWTLLGPASPIPPGPPGPPVVPVEPTPEGKGGQNNAQTNQTPLPSGAQSGVLGSTTSALPPPRLALTGNVIPLGGVVRVKLPGAKGFTLLTAGEQIPFGSIIDATLGRVAVTTADAHGALQTMVFYQGEFKLTQHRDGMVVSILFGGDFSKCPRTLQPGHLARASARAKHTVRKLWAEGHGSYSTKGNYATGAVLGTRWLTADLCEGTLIRVLTDRVAVTNLVNGKRVTVTAGHSYLAPARRKRHG